MIIQKTKTNASVSKAFRRIAVSQNTNIHGPKYLMRPNGLGLSLLCILHISVIVKLKTIFKALYFKESFRGCTEISHINPTCPQIKDVLVLPQSFFWLRKYSSILILSFESKNK